MFDSNSDKAWEKYGAKDPYFGVLTEQKYKKENLTEKNKVEFFKSGEEWIKGIFKIIRDHIDPAFNPDKVLDFGCGVGRLLIPLAAIAKQVVGVDVSDSMILEAKKNCEIHKITNINFIRSNDNLSHLEGDFDFIHSYIVFQHIPVKRGARIFISLLNHLNPGGVCALHFTYAHNGRFKAVKSWLIANFLFAINFRNLRNGFNFFAPSMQMNAYCLNKLFPIIQKLGVSQIFSQFTNEMGELGIIVFFQKPK